jgi:hypothetical protein
MTWIHLVDTPPAWDNGVVDILWSLVIPTNVVSAMERVITIGNALKKVRKQRVTTKVQAVGETVLLMVVVVGEAVLLMVIVVGEAVLLMVVVVGEAVLLMVVVYMEEPVVLVSY